MDPGELVFSWRNKRDDILGEPGTQDIDDCWAHALAQALSALIRLEGSKGPIPYPRELVDAVDEEHLNKTDAIEHTFSAPYLLKRFGRKLVHHQRPEVSEIERKEDFEKLIERLLAKHPVAVCFEYLPSYGKFRHAKKQVYCLDGEDLDALRFESSPGHYVVITGHGVVICDGKEIRFWDCLDSQGVEHGDDGYIRLERHKCLVKSAFEF